MRRKSISRKIEAEIKEKTPGWEGEFVYGKDGSWEVKTTSTKRFDYLYPGKTPKQANAALARDIHAIIKKHLPTSRVREWKFFNKKEK